MRYKGFMFVILISFLISFVACNTYTVEHVEYVNNDTFEHIESEIEDFDDDEEEEHQQITSTLISSRPQEEYLEDLDFLYNTLRDNFPYFGVIKRILDVDLHERYAITREHITTSNVRNDEHFIAILNHFFLNHARHRGHLDMLTGNFLKQHIQNFSSQIALGSDSFLNYLKEVDNPATRALHRLTDDDFVPPKLGENSLAFATSSNNIHTNIIEDEKIAYLEIRSMSNSTMHIDSETLLDFFHDVADYEHIIIDIRQNRGGSSHFFPSTVMAPNIVAPLEFHYYMFLMDGAHNKHKLEPRFGPWETSTYQPVSNDLLSSLEYLNADDAKLLSLYNESSILITPTGDEPIFKGKFWLLVGPRNFSASENAAAIAKETGFATLVGQTTGGDGLGFDPVVLALPNTGVIVRYSAGYGTDILGRNNQEFPTEPHIFELPGKDALQTVLYLIEKGEY